MPSQLFCPIFVLLLDDILDQFHNFLNYFQVISFFVERTVSCSRIKNSSHMKSQISISSNSEFLCFTILPLILKTNSREKEYVLFCSPWFIDSNSQCCSGSSSVKTRRRRRFRARWNDWLARSCCKLVVIAFLMTEAQAGFHWAWFYETFGFASTTRLKTIPWSWWTVSPTL